MDNRRYDYSPIIRRPRIEWPNHGRIALWVAPNIEYFHYNMPIRGTGSNHWPDVPGYSLRDYGARVGVYRIMEVLDKFNIRASVLLNAEVCEKHPAIIEEGNKRKWEWLGHGLTNSVSMLDYTPAEERGIIHNVKEIITKATGKAPKGWLGPGLGETHDTPDHLAAEGFEYVCDWGNDEQPTPMRVKSGRMLVVPHGQCQQKTGRQRQLKTAHHPVTESPCVPGCQPYSHDDRAQGDAHAPARMQPLHQPFPEMGRHVGIQTGIDRARPQPGEHAQQDHHPPLRDQGIADQRQAGEEAARGKHPAHAQA